MNVEGVTYTLCVPRGTDEHSGNTESKHKM